MTIKEIAKLSGVSISTVSKIINGKDEHITPQTRTRVLQIVKEYNFTPYGAVKNTSDARKYLIGVLLRSTMDSAYLLNGIIQAAQEHGYGIYLLDSQQDPELETKHITALCKNNVDGVIWEPVSPDSCAFQQEFDKKKIPVSLIQPSSYFIDFAQMGYYLTQTLVQNNHSGLACVLQRDNDISALFLEGFRQCLYENQIPFSDQMIYYLPDQDFIQNIIQYNVTGIVCAHFKSALSVYKELNKQHYDIPFDFSLVSLKKQNYENNMDSLISSVQIPYREFGAHICHQLIEICEKLTDDEPDYQYHPSCHLNHENSIGHPPFMNEKRIISIGAIHKDTIFNVNMLPQLGDSIKIHNSASFIGGKGANQAVGVARLGLPVCLLGAVGNDFDATFILNTLEKENVSTQGIHRLKKNQTGKAYIYTENDGESAITLLAGANDNLKPSDIEKSYHLFHNAKFCMISSEIPTETVLAAARIAKSNKAVTVFKPSVLDEIPEQLFQDIDILIPNRKESCALCPEYSTVEQQAEYFYNKGIPIVIITLGHNGCYLKCAKTARYFSAIDFAVVDTTGGADAFISALVSYLYNDYPLETAIQIAIIAAGFCVTRQGVTSALIDKNSLEVYIAKSRPYLLKQ